MAPSGFVAVNKISHLFCFCFFPKVFVERITMVTNAATPSFHGRS
jgi:hypothetical protein